MAECPGDSAAPLPTPRRSEFRRRAQALLLLETAIGDSALGCHNRAYLVHRARDEVARRSRYGQRLSVLLLESQGSGARQTGVLKELVAAVRLALRPTDTFARWQADEFVILLPCTGLAGATRLARRLAGLLTATAGRTGPPVDALIGIATAMGRHEGLELLIQRARNGLAEARAAGSRLGLG